MSLVLSVILSSFQVKMFLKYFKGNIMWIIKLQLISTIVTTSLMANNHNKLYIFVNAVQKRFLRKWLKMSSVIVVIIIN